MATETKLELQDVGLDKLKPSPDNPRQDLGDVSELAQSMVSVGVLSPLLVAKEADGTFTIVVGHRRWAAAKEAKLEVVPVIVRDLDSKTRLEIMLVENLQREDLTPIEEGTTFSRLIEEVGYSQRQLAERVGKSQAHISKRINLLNLPEAVQKEVNAGKLGIGDAEQLSRLPDPDAIKDVIKEAKANPMRSVRQIVDIDIADRQRIERVEAATAKAEEAGLIVVPEDEWRFSQGKKASAIGPETHDGLADIDPKVHAKLDCHAVGIDRNGKIVPLCLKPKTHSGKAPAKGKKGDAEGAAPVVSKAAAAAAKKEDARKAHEADLREAKKDRAAFLEGSMKRRAPKVELFAYVAWNVVESANTTVATKAAKLLGLGEGLEAGKSPQELLVAYATQSADALARAAEAAVFFDNEDALRYADWTSEEVKRHFEYLTKRGYDIAGVEEMVLAGKGPKE